MPRVRTNNRSESAPTAEEKQNQTIRVKEKDVPVRIRSGAGTNYTHVGGEYLGKGTFEVDIISKGMGSKSGWGHLANGRGWIALDFVEVVE